MGIDAEWRPEKKGEKNPVALLQLATRDWAVVVDLLQLCRTNPEVSKGRIPLGSFFMWDFFLLRDFIDLIQVLLIDYTAAYNMSQEVVRSTSFIEKTNKFITNLLINLLIALFFKYYII